MCHSRPLAAAQTVPRRGDVDANLEQHARLVRAAAGERAGVLVFPELSLTGYELDLAADLAFSEDDPRLVPLVELASVHDMILVVGAPVRVGPRLHIGAFIVYPHGAPGLYTKRHLGAGEEAAVQPGDRDPLVRLGDGIGAVAVCADANRPSHPSEAAARGARTYLVSTFIVPTEMEAKTASLRAYAVEHSMTVVFANYGGPSGGLTSAGRSAIWSDRGEPLAQLEGTGAGVVVAVDSDAGWRGRTVMLGDG